MVLLQVTPETDSLRQILVHHFPFKLGRSERNDLQLTDPGVWGEHCAIELDPSTNHFSLRSCPGALCFINGAPVEEAELHNGDLIQVGGCNIQFSLAPAPQGALLLRQALVWTLILCVAAAQAALVLFLNRF